MLKYAVWTIISLLNSTLLYSQSIEFNSGIMNGIERAPSDPNKNILYKRQDNFIDLRYLEKISTRKQYCFGLINSSDNFVIYTWDNLYPKSTIDYTNRVTTLYGGLRWQLPIFNSRFWFVNQLNFGLNWYRIEKKQYLHPGKNDFMQPTASPYFLEVIHRSHLKANLRYEVLFTYVITPKLSANINVSIQFPTETDYKFTTNTSMYGDYFENFFDSEEYNNVKSSNNIRYQIGAGIQYTFTK